MNNLIIPLMAFAGFVSVGCHHAPQSQLADNGDSTKRVTCRLELVTDQIHSPVAMAVPGDGSGRLFICQKEGKIWIIKNHTVIPLPFLDLSDKMVKVNPGYDERGLLGMAFSPHFKTDHKFYVYYSAPTTTAGRNNKSTVAEYQVSDDNPDHAAVSSERILLQIEDPESNHNGGDILFGPDGYLYIPIGDGGGGGDRHGESGNGQNLNTWLGKILRIDVHGSPYRIPPDNPFVGKENVKEEIWAYGVRNPWRISFDQKTGKLFAGEVGQNKYEEVDIIQKGGNYGWRVMEGFHVFNMPPGGADTSSFIPPIDEYAHKTTGISIIGGYVYRGHALPALQGKYVFGDYNGRLFTLIQNNGGGWSRDDFSPEGKPESGFQLFSFGQDEKGELYVLGAVSQNNSLLGKVYRMVE